MPWGSLTRAIAALGVLGAVTVASPAAQADELPRIPNRSPKPPTSAHTGLRGVDVLGAFRRRRRARSLVDAVATGLRTNCPPALPMGCDAPGRSAIALNTGTNAKLGWKFAKGGTARAIGDFGDPLGSTTHTFCLYSQGTRIAEMKIPPQCRLASALDRVPLCGSYRLHQAASEGRRSRQAKGAGQGQRVESAADRDAVRGPARAHGRARARRRLGVLGGDVHQRAYERRRRLARPHAVNADVSSARWCHPRGVVVRPPASSPFPAGGIGSWRQRR